MSDPRNIKVGVCRVYYGPGNGTDMGYTQGGVEFTSATETHKTMVDQFGKTIIDETIIGRSCEAKVPLAETTLVNMAKIMPGAVLRLDGGAHAAGSATFTAACANGDKINVNGVVWTFATSPVASTDVAIGTTAADQASKFATAVNASLSEGVEDLTFVATSAAVAITAVNVGTKLNNTILSTTSSAITLVGITGGSEPTAARVDIPTGVGISLLSIAQQLRLHPIGRPENDFSEDIILPKAATPGSIQFAYKLENERIFNCTFTGYPDVNGTIFSYGSPAAT